MSDSHVRFAMSYEQESDTASGLPARLRECIADETVSSFARRCQLPEATIRSYLDGKKPVFDKLVKIADAAGVTVDWLATGRGPRSRAELMKTEENQRDSASLDALAGPHARRWAKLIELVESALNPEEAEALLNEFLARARQQAELAELRQAVRDLTASLQKRS
ncbi:MAG TPA: transcriptional regulator [Rhodocyclaceae bacterium]|nr:transcriptional regulator [Rhodocyclaceae bacterium]